MKFLRWKNPYIDLVSDKRESILDYGPEGYQPELLSLLQEKLTQHDQVYCEIGSGSGGHIIEQAKKTPHAHFVGFELRFKRTFRTIEKAEQQDISNITMIRGDAQTITDIFSKNSLSGMYIHFPDPWSKKKWKKHRILSEENLRTFSDYLRSDGFLSYKTDHEEYFRESLHLLERMPEYAVEWKTADLWASEHIENNVPTEFEMLFRSKKLPIYALRARKSPLQPPQ